MRLKRPQTYFGVIRAQLSVASRAEDEKVALQPDDDDDNDDDDDDDETVLQLMSASKQWRS